MLKKGLFATVSKNSLLVFQQAVSVSHQAVSANEQAVSAAHLIFYTPKAVLSAVLHLPKPNLKCNFAHTTHCLPLRHKTAPGQTDRKKSETHITL